MLSASSVDCERGFSTLNRIKTNLRTKLKGDHLEALMRVSGMDISLAELLNHSKALIMKWRNLRARRTGDKADELFPMD